MRHSSNAPRVGAATQTSARSRSVGMRSSTNSVKNLASNRAEGKGIKEGVIVLVGDGQIRVTN